MNIHVYACWKCSTVYTYMYIYIYVYIYKCIYIHIYTDTAAGSADCARLIHVTIRDLGNWGECDAIELSQTKILGISVFQKNKAPIVLVRNHALDAGMPLFSCLRMCVYVCVYIYIYIYIYTDI
jgi:hypothetical protein